MAFGKLRQRNYSFRVQQFAASATKGRRVQLIAAKRVWSKGKTLTSGEKAWRGALKSEIAQPKIATRGRKIKAGGAKNAEKDAQIGDKWKKAAKTRDR